MPTHILARDRSFQEFRDELFRVQCRILDLGTERGITAKELRQELMVLRDEIIEFRETTSNG